MKEKAILKWEDFHNDMSRIEWLMHNVLGWECYQSWDSYYHKYGAQEYALGAGTSFTTPTPVAFCDPGVYWEPVKTKYKAEWRVFTPDHEQMFVFDPLQSLDDAWRLVERITQPQTKPLGLEAPNVRFRAWWEQANVWAMGKEEAASEICKAIYRAWHNEKGRPEPSSINPQEIIIRYLQEHYPRVPFTINPYDSYDKTDLGFSISFPDISLANASGIMKEINTHLAEVRKQAQEQTE